MNINPEFRRNLWLEVTPYRLISMPLILLAIFYLAFLSDGNRLASFVSTASVTLFFVISLLWGTRLASESIMNEIRDHTWDGQRMSIISPWELTWGKLFGSTIYTWYGAAICLFVYMLSAGDKSILHTFKIVLALALAAVLSHAVSLLASLIALQKERKFNKSQTAAFLMLGIVIAVPFIKMATDSSGVVEWFGRSFASIDFIVCSLSCYMLWTITGIFQVMRVELQMKNKPWLWLCFVLFLMVHVGGFYHESQPKAIGMLTAVSPSLLAAFFVAVCVTYGTAFTERKDFLSFYSLVRLAYAKKWESLLERSPRWLLSLPVSIVTGILVILFALTGHSGDAANVGWFVLTILLFMTRDFGIMLFCNLGKSGKRADIMTMLYLALLYGLFPAILTVMQLETATQLFWPRPELNPLWGVAASLLEAIVVGYIAARRWRQRLAEEGK